MTLYRHKKRGSIYELIGFGRMQASNWIEDDREYGGDAMFTSVDMQEVAIYRTADGNEVWVRPRAEFEDGRFEELK